MLPFSKLLRWDKFYYKGRIYSKMNDHQAIYYQNGEIINIHPNLKVKLA